MNQRFGNQGNFPRLAGLIRGCVALMFSVAGSNCPVLVVDASEAKPLLSKINLAEFYLSADQIQAEQPQQIQLIDELKRLRTEASCRSCNLSGIDLSGADLVGVYLQDANLSGTNLSDADLFYANLVGANLSQANLESADLGGVNLFKANLSNANLRKANLRDAILTEATLDGADFSDAILCGATMPDGSISKQNCF
ncbi:MAG TPA: pentapeptide repeat-containing protein [Cyanophyceae cyanobacterium]